MTLENFSKQICERGYDFNYEIDIRAGKYSLNITDESDEDSKVVASVSGDLCELQPNDDTFHKRIEKLFEEINKIGQTTKD